MSQRISSGPRDHAVVIGRGITGLLAARVLSDHFANVTVIERDSIPLGVEPRKGAPQGRHVHALLAKGEEILDRLFPGLTAALLADGAVRADMGRHFRWHHHGVWKANFDSGVAITLLTRPFLEFRIAERVAALPNVQVVSASVERLVYDSDRHGVSGLLISAPAGETIEIGANLVVDAGGRGSQLPQWLESMGYRRPEETALRVDVTYASQLLRGQREHGWHALHFTAVPPCNRHGVIFAVEGERMLATLVGFHGERPPADEPGFLDYARSLPVPDIHRVIAAATPLESISLYSFPANLRRHYERLETFPDGLLVAGDAICSFNPVYGQGMTLSALQIATLDRLLRARAEGDLSGLSRQFHRATAEVIDSAWRITTGEDLRHPQTAGARPVGAAFLHWYTARLHACSSEDVKLAQAFFRVMHLLDPPGALFHPRVAWRTLRWRDRRRAAAPRQSPCR